MSHLTDSADEDLLNLVGLALALWGGVLGVDLLPVQGVGRDGEDALNSLGGSEGDEAEAAAPLELGKRNNVGKMCYSVVYYKWSFTFITFNGMIYGIHCSAYYSPHSFPLLTMFRLYIFNVPTAAQ